MTEVTVNIYSLAAQRTLGQPSNLLTVDPKTGLNHFQTALPKLGIQRDQLREDLRRLRKARPAPAVGARLR
ncbi:hypothetical protein [Streptomyces sp. NBC_00046]|uniref:hypothetical protein n=1 Tax=Streptomyces sp. NBC_00046 TaxID=2975626 RepID=UPI00324332B4